MNRAFLSEFSRGMPASTYVIHAENSDFYFFVKRAYSKIKKQFGGDEGFRFTSYDFGDLSTPENPTTIHQIIDDANALSFFGERKAVLVDNLQALRSDSDSLLTISGIFRLLRTLQLFTRLSTMQMPCLSSAKEKPY